MAQGDNNRPLETSDSKPVDRKDVLGNSSLHIIDSRSIELLELLLEEQKKTNLYLSLLVGEEIEGI